MLTVESSRWESVCICLKIGNFFPSCGSVLLLVAALAQNTSTGIITDLSFQVFDPCVF